MPILEHSTNNSDLRENFLQKNKLEKQGTAIYMEGTRTTLRIPTSDVDAVFRQESNFYYLTGCLEADCAALINLETHEFVLLVPPYGDEYALWCGEYPEKQDFQKKLQASTVEYNEKALIQQVLQRWQTKKIYTLEHDEQAAKKILEGMMESSNIAIDASKALYFELKDARLIKNEREIEELRKIGRISAVAHAEVMKNVRPGMKENEIESFFLRAITASGCKHLAYSSIVAGDDRGATLHYVNNDQVCHDGGLLLIDAGAEARTLYASDITRTYPVNGKFTEDQKLIYNLVLKAHYAVLDAMKPGAQWSDLHRLSLRIITEELWKAGLLKADNLQELLDNHIGALFFPHGLGHCMGLDVHDPPNRDGSFKVIDEPGIRYLRVDVKLEKGMVLTVEPGCYFIPRFLNRALTDEKQSKYLVKEKIERFMKFGGIRIEDDVVVTDDGVEILTPGVPKDVDEIEKLMASGKQQ